LTDRAERLAKRIAFVFTDTQKSLAELTYLDLYERAAASASWLRSFNVRGEPVLLLLPHGPEYLTAFFACILSGAIPVPLFPARGRDKDNRLESVARDSGASVALIAPDGLRLNVPALQHLSIPAEIEGDHQVHLCSASDPAFLQYTSGSTGSPKGVVVTHSNLVANSRMIQAAFSTTSNDVMASWLPFFHDMGMVGVVLQTIFLGAKAVLFSPSHFLKNPLSWMHIISAQGATVSGGPNFGYDLCAKRCATQDLEGIDLAQWRVAFTGAAEPVRQATIERFEKVSRL
jgi:acyl-CoA synthetase (AMP-forming)/AMP-acid ligase II